jgi:hypothetical protein
MADRIRHTSPALDQGPPSLEFGCRIGRQGELFNFADANSNCPHAAFHCKGYSENHRFGRSLQEQLLENRVGR